MSRSVIVVGSGLAGLTCALRAARSGCAVTVVTKAGLGEGNTARAQGGMAAAVLAADSPAAHLRDTETAGAGAVDRAAAGVLVAAGPQAVADLEALGVAFDRDAAGDLLVGLEGAHSHPRILHAGGDATGAEIQRALDVAVRSFPFPDRLVVREHVFAVDLISSAGRVRGVTALVDGRLETIEADAVVLATGGAGRLYAHTTNPAVATGDGLALALRAGARVADLEFVQFHPTALEDGTLVSEAVRGEGAVLLDATGRRFAFDADPDGELAPRDVVARAIARVMAAQAGAPVRLDATALGHDPAETAEFLAARFPTIDRAVRDRGWDWSRETVPVTPAAHYLMGGVVTDLDGRTTLPGLYAVGEVARTGVHGANRLASNSLLEAAVFGARAGGAVSADLASADPASGGEAPVADVRGAPVRDAAPEACPGAPFSRAALQQLMWDRVGLERTDAGLTAALDTIDAWRAGVAAPRTVAEHEDANLLVVARALTSAARARTQSLGAHHRSDGDGRSVPGADAHAIAVARTPVTEKVA